MAGNIRKLADAMKRRLRRITRDGAGDDMDFEPTVATFARALLNGDNEKILDTSDAASPAEAAAAIVAPIKGTAGGVAALNEEGIVPFSQLPDIPAEAPVQSVAGKQGAVVLDRTDVGLNDALTVSNGNVIDGAPILEDDGDGNPIIPPTLLPELTLDYDEGDLGDV